MSKERVLLKVLCPNKHELARAVATTAGPVLRTKRITLWDLNSQAAKGYRADAGDESDRLLTNDPVYGSDSITATCGRCGTEHHFLPVQIRQAIAERKRVLEFPSRRAH